MADVAVVPFQPATVNTAPPSPASSASSTALAPRPVQLSPSGLWKPTPTLKDKTSTQNFSHPMALPTLPASAALTPSSTSTAVATIPRSTPTPTSLPTRLPSLKTPTSSQTQITPTTPRSILKPGDIHPANRPPAYSPTTSSSTSSSSLNYTSKSKAQLKSSQNATERRSRGKSIKEGAFFAFVLLPLSCWYTRGGKRLGTASGPPPPQSLEYGTAGGKRNVIEWDGDEEDEEILVAEYERRGRAATASSAALPELRRPVYGHGRKDSFGQVAAGGMKGQVIARRESFTAPVPPGVSLRGGGHGRSNSFSSAGMRGRGDGMGMVVARREVADYGIDRGPDEWHLERERELAREAEFERLRLGRAKSRTGSPVPLRRRRSEV